MQILFVTFMICTNRKAFVCQPDVIVNTILAKLFDGGFNDRDATVVTNQAYGIVQIIKKFFVVNH